MIKFSNKRKRQSGITILESLISTAIIGIGFVAIFQMVNFSVQSIDSSSERTKANYLVSMIAEDVIAHKITNTSFERIEACGPKINTIESIKSIYETAVEDAAENKKEKWNSIFKTDRYLKCKSEKDIKDVKIFQICKTGCDYTSSYEEDESGIHAEVYDEMLFEGVQFTSPLGFPKGADRVVVVSSISKSHAAPGFRSGWSIGSKEFTKRLLPLAETMLFGNQPFIADMTAFAVSQPSKVAADMRQRFEGRARLIFARLNGIAGLRVSQPEAGMFVLIDVSSTGLTGEVYALDLLEKTGVAVMPGSAFGVALDNWVRVALSVEDKLFEIACQRIIDHALVCNQASVMSQR